MCLRALAWVLTLYYLVGFSCLNSRETFLDGVRKPDRETEVCWLMKGQGSATLLAWEVWKGAMSKG